MRAGQIDLLDLVMPIVVRPSAPVTDEQLLRFSERNKPWRVERNINGEITMMTPVNFIGAKHEGYVAAALLVWAEEDGRGSALPAGAGFNLPDGSCLSPDAAWLTREHEDALTPEQKASFPPICPDFIIEIRSKSDPRRMVESKMQTWMDNGAKLAWLIDPLAGTIMIYRPGKAPEVLDRPDTIVATEPIDGFVLRCSRLWSPR